MPLWDADGTSNTTPNWYQKIQGTKFGSNYTRHNHANRDNLQFDDRGYEKTVQYTDQHGNTRTKTEVVVANRRLANNKSQPIYVVGLEFGNVAPGATMTQGQKFTFRVIFNQPVFIPDGSSTKWTYWAGGSTDVTNATYLSGNTTNVLTYVGTANGTHSNAPHRIRAKWSFGGAELFIFDPATGLGKVYTTGTGGLNTITTAGVPSIVSTASRVFDADDSSIVINAGMANTV